MNYWAVTLLAMTAACGTRRVSERAPGEATMNELMHRRTDARNAPPATAPTHPARPSPGDLQAAEAPNAPAFVYAAAIRFYVADDKPRALATLDRAERAYPDDEQWRSLRARVYFESLVGSRGPLQYGVVQAVSKDDASGKFAQEIKRRLSDSKDPQLLLALGRELSVLRLSPQALEKLDFDPLALAKGYVEQARRYGGDADAISASLDRIEQRRNYDEIAQLLRGHRMEEALTLATPTQKLFLLNTSMTSAAYRDDREKSAAAARLLLELTGNSPQTPQALQFRSNAQLLLGKIALRNGDPRTAVRQLLASVEKPFPRQQYSFELARSLVDWGYREDVARYLELAARGHRDSQKLTEWAALIRQGRNPDMIPYQTGCGKEPC